MRRLSLTIATAACLCAQQPPVENAKLATRTFSGSMAAGLAQLGAGPFWAAWSEPIVPGRRGDMCDGRTSDAPIRLEGPTALVVLVRVENSQVDRLRVATPDCRMDAGGLPFYWLTAVPADESVAWLRTQAGARNSDTPILAIALHAGPAADRALDDLVAAGQPDRVREKTAFWLADTRGAHGVEVLKRMLANDASEKVREQAIFALTQSKEADAMAVVLDAAKNHKDPRIRGRALFWIAQKAANQQARDAIGNAIASDPERTVKEQAVFALTQLPEGQGVPMLIDLAKDNPDPAVRKKAMFWLGQSKDPRALDFFAQLLQ